MDIDDGDNTISFGALINGDAEAQLGVADLMAIIRLRKRKGKERGKKGKQTP